MLLDHSPSPRSLRCLEHDADLVVVGGGLAGVCAAVTAARAGLCVVLFQDRPVLGGNSSSEVRLWVLGATSHMGNNNRWAREGGVIDEILVENLRRNREGNPVIFDTVLLELVAAEPRITLLLNTAVHDAASAPDGRIASVAGFCSQNSTRHVARAPLFCDASGDGVLGFLSGAAFRMGAEARDEFGEGFAPDAAYGELLGHTLYFYTKDAGRPVAYVPPTFALADITEIPRFRSFNARDFGCRLWWIEYGGRLDTVHDTERIKWELWKVVYGVWHHIKNSGLFPDAATLTLEWVGAIPGKRESRRFEGDYILRQQDVVSPGAVPDAVSYGGWSIDLHPADGVYSPLPGCNQWHARGVYPITYRCLYSRNIPNLFLAGRIISVSHVAFGSTRVMGTCAHGAQAVALAAAHCRAHGLLPRDLLAPARMAALQTELLRSGQFIPGLARRDPADLAQAATLSATSEWALASLPADGPPLPLTFGWAQMLPLPAGPAPVVSLEVAASAPTTLVVELRTGRHPDDHTPDVILARREFSLAARPAQPLVIDFAVTIDAPRYAFVTFLQNPLVTLPTSTLRATGLLSVCKHENPEVSNYGEQVPPPDIGVERFEFWCPQRRPAGHNLALRLDPPLAVFGAPNAVNGLGRPTRAANAWVADPADPAPALSLRWPSPQTIRRVVLVFDTDYDHPAETTLWGHPEHRSPFCVSAFTIRTAGGRVLAAKTEWHQTRAELVFAEPVITDTLVLELAPAPGGAPASLFEIACFGAAGSTTNPTAPLPHDHP
jgi:hypothetical protein